MPNVDEITLLNEMRLRCEFQNYINNIYGPMFTSLRDALDAMAEFENERGKQLKAALEAVKDD